MSVSRPLTLFAVAACTLALAAFKSARVEVPTSLAAAPELAVTGHNPRTWNRPLAFGPYRTTAVHEGVEFSWSVEVFGVRGGMARQRYRLVLEGPDADAWEVECVARSIEAWRHGWSVELTRAFTPRLVCGLRERTERQAYRLILGSAGNQLRGVVHFAGSAAGEPPLLAIRSLHRLEGSRLPLGEPAGYAIERSEAALAAVEILNRGRVWLAEGLQPEERGPAAAAAAALLLYKHELSPEE